MAARDNVLFYASVGSGTAAGTEIPLSLLYGIENVRQGYGTPVLKNARAVHYALYSTARPSVPIQIKNSNWIDSAGIVSQNIDGETAINRDSIAFMRGRDKVLAPNTSWIITAKLAESTTVAGFIYVLLEIEYSDVPGLNPENRAGSPVVKTCSNASVTGAANTYLPLGTFDNLLQGKSYVLSEASLQMAGAASSANFLIVEGFSSQRGLVRIVPIKNYGLADQIEGSVVITKQTYNLGLIRSVSSSAAATDVYLEMIADSN